MYAHYTTTKKGTWAYIQKTARVDGRVKTFTIKRLGLLSDIQKETGCEDPIKWVEELAAKMTQEEREEKKGITVELYPNKNIEEGDRPLRHGGDLALLGLYNKLGLPGICSSILKSSRAKYDLNEILQTLVTSRLLFPCSKISSYERAKNLVKPPMFREEEMFRSLSLLSSNIDMIQAEVYRNSLQIVTRRDKMLFYDCTNYYFEIEDNDKDVIDKNTGEVILGLRKRGKSKEHRPNPIVQMGMFMDYDGIPLAFKIFPGNESEQTSLQPLEETLNHRFGMTDYIVSTDAGIASESNRRYNMRDGREYISVQSIPSLKNEDRAMVLAPEGWRISFCKNENKKNEILSKYSINGIFNLNELLKVAKDNSEILKNITLYKEILVEKNFDGGKRMERVIVTYNHDFALYLKHKRAERIKLADKIVKNKQTKSRQSQQDPRHYVTTTHKTKDGQKAIKVEMAINQDIISQEEKLDGFYAYATSLNDNAVDVLRIRSFHNEIEHIFRSTKSLLNARPVYLSRQDRIKAHFLICFLAMVILKILQKKLIENNKNYYENNNLTIDKLVNTIRDIQFAFIAGKGYIPMFSRNSITDQLQELIGYNISTQIIPTRKMNTIYRNVK